LESSSNNNLQFRKLLLKNYLKNSWGISVTKPAPHVKNHAWQDLYLEGLGGGGGVGNWMLTDGGLGAAGNCICTDGGLGAVG
jgi:hypothetical protein